MNSEPTSILIFRNGSIGNTLVAVPGIRAIRKRYPAAKLAVVVDSIGHELLKLCPWIDQFIVYDKHGKDRGIIAHLRLIQRLRSLRPTHAVLLKRFFRNGLLAYLSGAQVRLGFRTAGKAPFLNQTIPYDEDLSIVDLNLKLAAQLDAVSDDRRLEMWISEDDEAAARRVAGDSAYVVAHYGGQTTAPDFFPAEQFVKLLARIAGSDQRVILIGSGLSEIANARQMAAVFPVASAQTDLPLQVSAALIRSARLFLGFNSGPAHLAAAVGTPEIVFFRPDVRAQQEIRKWAPVSSASISFVPPTTSDSESWTAFLQTVDDSAQQLMRRSAAMVEKS